MISIEMASGFADELEKISAPRYEKEIQKGNISRQQVTPGVPNLPTPVGQAVSRKMTRDTLHAPASASNTSLSKKRQLADKLYSVQAKTPNILGKDRRVDFFNLGMARTNIPSAGSGIPPVVSSPDNSAQVLRGMPDRGLIKNIAHNVKNTWQVARGRMPTLPMAESHPSDPTMNHAVLQHELGEAAEGMKPNKKVLPFSSHMGPEPILRENLALQGDPDAIKHMQQLRKKDPGDVAVQKMIRRAGGTPDAPIPLGGRQHAAVTKMLENRGDKGAGIVGRGRALQFASGGFNVPYLSPEVAQSASAFNPEHIQDTFSGISRNLNSGKYREGLKGIGGFGRKAGKALKYLYLGK